ncbi:MAG: hypothetical protein V4636_05400 [Pseudomonadota bacterium]
MTRSEYTQHADPAVRRRVTMRLVRLPAGVNALHCADGKINGEDVLLLFTTDGLYSVRDGVAHKCPETPARPFRSTDRDYRPLWIALVGVATLVALWRTL